MRLQGADDFAKLFSSIVSRRRHRVRKSFFVHVILQFSRQWDRLVFCLRLQITSLFQILWNAILLILKSGDFVNLPRGILLRRIGQFQLQFCKYLPHRIGRVGASYHRTGLWRILRISQNGGVNLFDISNHFGYRTYRLFLVQGVCNLFWYCNCLLQILLQSLQRIVIWSVNRKGEQGNQRQNENSSQ